MSIHLELTGSKTEIRNVLALAQSTQIYVNGFCFVLKNFYSSDKFTTHCFLYNKTGTYFGFHSVNNRERRSTPYFKENVYF